MAIKPVPALAPATSREPDVADSVGTTALRVAGALEESSLVTAASASGLSPAELA